MLVELGIDTTYRDAFVGRVGAASYSIHELSQGSGVLGVTTVFRRDCDALAPATNCEVGVDDHCLDCVDASDAEPICGP